MKELLLYYWELIKPWKEFGYTLERNGVRYWGLGEMLWKTTIGLLLWVVICVPLLTILFVVTELMYWRKTKND